MFIDRFEGQNIREIFNGFMLFQQRQFNKIQKQCMNADVALLSLEQASAKLEQRLSVFENKIQTKKLTDLRKQQDEFIISELKAKNQKLTIREDEMHDKLFKSESQISILKHKIQELEERQVKILREEVLEKEEKIRYLMQEYQKLKKGEIERSPKKIQERLENSEYIALSEKLTEMQTCMSEQIAQLKKSNKKLVENKQKNEENLINKEIQASKKIYALQLKVKYLTQANSELENTYSEVVKKSGQNEVSLHQKIIELKNLYQQQKKRYKQYKHSVQKNIKKFGVEVLQISQSKIGIIIGKGNIEQQLAEIKKQIVKEKKKNITMASMENETIIQQLNIELNGKRRKIKELEDKLEKKKKDIQQKQNSSTNKSTHDISDEKTRGSVEKLRAQIKINSNIIQELKKKLDQQETQFNESILLKEKDISILKNKLRFLENEFEQEKEEWEKSLNSERKLTKKNEQMYLRNTSDLESKIQELMQKSSENYQVVREKQSSKKQIQRRFSESQEKNRKDINKLLNQLTQCSKVIESKQKIIDQLIHKNQAKTIELKLLTEKNKILELSIAEKHTKNEPLINKDLEQQIRMQKQRIFERLALKEQEMLEKQKQIEEEKDEKKKMKEEISYLQQRIMEASRKNEMIENENEILLKELKSVSKYCQKEENILQTNPEVQILQNKIIQLRKQIKEKDNIITSQNLTIFREREASQKKLKEKDVQLHQILQKLNLMENHSSKSNANGVKIQQPKTEPKFKTFKGTDSFEMIDCGTMTDPIQFHSQSVNTFPLTHQKLENSEKGFNLSVKNSRKKQDYDHILDFVSKEKSVHAQDLVEEKKQQPKETQPLRSSNLFQHLDEGIDLNENAFEICDQEEEINFGQSAANLEIREMFTHIRVQIEKLFNDQQISVSALKQLPNALQDDFLQFTAYLKEKILEIKNHNDLSFIMAEIGNEPEEKQEDLSLDLPTIIQNKISEKEIARLLQEKEALISNLLSEKTEQQNTINQLTVQKEEIEEQNENRFMNQCNVYKREIKEYKKIKDLLEMNFQSLKNIIKNILQTYSDEEDVEDDFRDNLMMLIRVGNLSQKEKTRLNYHIKRYQEIKNVH